MQWYHDEWSKAMDDHDRLLIIGPRHHGKSTIIVGRALWELGRNPNLRIIIGCAGDVAAQKRLGEAKKHPNNGGYWLISGHEPDITGTEPSWEEHKQRRIEQYKIIRQEDPDIWNHPVFIFYDMTSTYDRAPGAYPGWEYAFTGEDHDVFLIDCYPGKEDGSLDYEGMEKAARLVEIGLSRSKGQFIPNLDADYLPGDKPPNVIEQFEWWSKRFNIAGVCFWHGGHGTSGIGVYEDEYLQEQVKEINRRLGLL